jgi:hypothetical protein
MAVPRLELAGTARSHHLRHVTQPRELRRSQQHVAVTPKAGPSRLIHDDAAPLGATQIGNADDEGRGKRHGRTR